jgi:carnosine synthase
MYEDVNPLKGKTILLVSTGSERKKFILERMRELGLRIVVLDDHLEPWASTLIDACILIPQGTPLEIVLKKVKNECLSHGVEGAITFWEEEIPLLAHICAACGFAGNSVETALRTRSKFLMQETFRKHRLPAIRECIVRNEEDLNRAMATIGFPAVLKPLFGSDSLSVIRVDNPPEARMAYDYVQENFTMPYEKLYQYERGEFVYQTFIAGTEFSVECYCQNGECRVAGIHEKTPMRPPFFVETGDYVPPRISDDQRCSLEGATIAGLRALGVTNSLAHVEVKWSPTGPQIIEAASRMGGDYTYHAVKTVHDFDLVRAGCEIALGIPVQERPTPPGKFLVAKYFIPQVSGVISRMGSVNLLHSLPGVKDFYIASKTGEAILVPPSGFDNVGWVTVEGNSLEDAERNLAHVFRTFPLHVRPFQTEEVLPRRVHEERRSLAAQQKPEWATL